MGLGVNFEIPFTVGPAKVIYVDDDSPSGSPNGTTWSKAYSNLQDALDAAWSGDEIRVAQGVYRPDQGGSVSSGDRAASFDLRQGVDVKGGYPRCRPASMEAPGQYLKRQDRDGDYLGPAGTLADSDYQSNQRLRRL